MFQDAEMYLNTIHEAFIHLIVAGRQSLPKDEIANRISTVFREIQNFFRQKRISKLKAEPKSFSVSVFEYS